MLNISEGSSRLDRQKYFSDDFEEQLNPRGKPPSSHHKRTPSLLSPFFTHLMGLPSSTADSYLLVQNRYWKRRSYFMKKLGSKPTVPIKINAPIRKWREPKELQSTHTRTGGSSDDLPASSWSAAHPINLSRCRLGASKRETYIFPIQYSFLLFGNHKYNKIWNCLNVNGLGWVQGKMINC